MKRQLKWRIIRQFSDRNTFGFRFLEDSTSLRGKFGLKIMMDPVLNRRKSIIQRCLDVLNPECWCLSLVYTMGKNFK